MCTRLLLHTVAQKHITIHEPADLHEQATSGTAGPADREIVKQAAIDG